MNNLSKSVFRAFGLSTMTWGVLNAMSITYWAYFLTDIAKIGTNNVAIMVPAVRFIDIFTAVVAGVIIQKSYFRWGKYRSWLLLAPPIVVVFFILLFLNPDVPLIVKIVYFWIAGCTTTLVTDLMVNNLLSVVPTVAKEVRDRDVLATKRGQGSIIGKIIFGATALPLILFFNKGSEAGELGYLLTVLVFGLPMIASFWWLFKLVPNELASGERYDLKQLQASSVNFSLREMLAEFINCRPLVAVILADATRYTAQMTLNGLAIYYFQNVYHDITLLAVMLTIANATAFLTSFIAEPLTIKVDKHLLYKIGLATMSLSFACIFLFGYGDWRIFIGLGSLAFVGGGFMSAVSISLYADGVLYSQWKSGHDNTGFMMSMASIAPKAGQFLAFTIIGLTLTGINYVAGVDLTEQGKYWLHCAISVFPAVILGCGFLVMCLFNKLDRTTMEKLAKARVKHT